MSYNNKDKTYSPSCPDLSAYERFVALAKQRLSNLDKTDWYNPPHEVFNNVERFHRHDDVLRHGRVACSGRFCGKKHV